MATRHHFHGLLIFLMILALFCLFISFKPVMITTRTEKSRDWETNGEGVLHLRRIEIDEKRRTMKRILMKVEEVNDYPGSGANNRHTPPKPHCPDC